jgi:hypothetical protein
MRCGKKDVLAVILVLALLWCTIPAGASDVPGYGGMTKISDNTFLTVNDRKNPIHPGYRLGIIKLTEKDGIVFTPIEVLDWMHEEKEPSDLEACCAIPGRGSEFLIAESGFYKGSFGRIFHIALSRAGGNAWNARVIKAFKIYTRPLDAKKRTFKGDQVEGLACFNALGKTILVYGERGGAVHNGKKLGTLVWGTLDLGTHRFQKIGEAPLVDTSLLDARDCSDIHLVPEKNGSISVLSIATQDAGDNGPFYSVLYRAGRFVIDPKAETVRFVRGAEPEIFSVLSGIKVDALAGPAKNAPESKYSIATDDEIYGGIWRPIFGN